MYTFFHPLLRDEQEAQKERLALPKLRGKWTRGRGGEWGAPVLLLYSDLVYTFFHPLLRDEQEAQKERLALPKLRGKGTLGEGGMWNNKITSQ